jgi:hypothetical protein
MIQVALCFRPRHHVVVVRESDDWLLHTFPVHSPVPGHGADDVWRASHPHGQHAGERRRCFIANTAVCSAPAPTSTRPTSLHGRMARGGHGLPKVSPGLFMPYPSKHCGRATPETVLQPFQRLPAHTVVSLQSSSTPWTPHAVRL